jgi:alpha-beta hydrolase superfamily lysophospholipase
METRTGTLEGAGGVPIHWTCAAPAAGPRGVVVAVHGYAEHCGRYPELTAHLVERGLGVAALDLRGHGRSGGRRGHCLDFAEYVDDVRRLVGVAEERWPGVPRVLFGHSMGGLIGFLYLLDHPETVRAGALSAPAFRVPDMPWFLHFVALLLARIAPALGVGTKLDVTGLARDPEVGKAYLADPLVHRRASPGFVRALEAAQARAVAEAAALGVPLLVAQGDADRIVAPAGAREIAARLRCEHELVMLPGYYHELLNEPPGERARVIALLDAWIDRWLRG